MTTKKTSMVKKAKKIKMTKKTSSIKKARTAKKTSPVKKTGTAKRTSAASKARRVQRATKTTPPATSAPARLVAKLKALRALDRGKAVFGASAHRYRLEAPLTERQLAAFERKVKTRLPEDYRAFLLEAGSAGAGPEYGLKPLAEFRADRLPRVVTVIQEESGEVISVGTGERPDLARAADPGLPFLMKEAWAPVGSEGNAAPLPLPEGVNPYDGCLYLAEIGCGYFYFLVLTGEQRGQVWEDYTAGDGAMAPTGYTFTGWYETWLDRNLREQILMGVRSAFMEEQAGAETSKVAEKKAHAGRKPVAAAAGRSRVESTLRKAALQYRALLQDAWEKSKAPNDHMAVAFVDLYLGDRESALAVLAQDGENAPEAAAELRRQLYKEDFQAARARPPRDVERLASHAEADVRGALAENPATPETALFHLAGDADSGVLCTVAKHPAASARTVARLFEAGLSAWGASHEDARAVVLLERVARHESATPAMREALSRLDEGIPERLFADVIVRAAALCPKTPADALMRLSGHGAPWIRHGVACNPGAPEAALEGLSRDPNRAVREAVAANPGAPGGIIARLAVDPEEEVRAGAAENPKAPREVLLRLACERSRDVGYALARNPSLPEEARECLAFHPDDVLPDPAEKAEASSDEDGPIPRDAASSMPVHRDALDHPSFPVALLGRYLEAIEASMPAATGAAVSNTPLHPVLQLPNPDMAAYTMARSPWLSTEQIEVLSRHPYSYARSRIAEHPLTPVEVLVRLCEDPAPMVRAAAAGQSRAPVERAVELARSEEEDVRAGAGKHPALPEDVIRALVEDDNPWVRRSVIFGEHAPLDVLEKLSRDPETHVRRWVCNDPRTPAHAIDALLRDEDEDVRKWARWRKAADVLAASLANEQAPAR